ncbi:restriction endonuclease subunit S [Clostridium estertheticum]|uniref:restriction endonuclease subunit S n=1 Tax=Clostridium estertheticum TaxID=238834 RepID=UPI001CF25D83|nr:restriction endonuclease subunit S [Clostridium estertheticum]MCB2361955.1 restriction endonuclease subunit S [Clostridium estertheticum]
MSENEKSVPKRRFKEFENAEAWEQRKLGEFGFFYYGKSAPKWSVTQDAKTPCVRYGELYTKYLEKIDKIYSYTNIPKDNLKFSTGKEVLVPRVGEDPLDFANCSWLSIPDVAIGEMISVYNTEQNPLFTAYMFNALLKYEFAKRVEGGNVSNLYYMYLEDIPVSFPSIDEQEKIAAFLTDISNLITLNQRKLEKMKVLKKAYLTDMFPTQGKRKPKLRFAGFTDDWEQRKIKEVCSISTGKSNTQDRIDDGIYPFYVRSPIIEHSNRYLYDEEAVLTVGDGVGTGKVFHYVNGKYDLHQRVYRMFDFINGTSGKYFYYYFSNHFYDRVMTMTAKTSVDSVRLEMISEMDIMLPTVKEQGAITGFFDNLHNLITLHQRKLRKLQNIKKAYLNEMFI